MSKITVSIVGGSGYTGGELLRLLLFHPKVDLKQVTSERFTERFVFKLHPNLRRQTNLKFCSVAELQGVETLFLCLPHGKAMEDIEKYEKIGVKIIDLSGDFRLRNKEDYEKWYNRKHLKPERLGKFVYGIPELHREEIKNSNFISCAGCNATASILSLYPLFKNNLVDPDRTVIEVKVGSSEGGNNVSPASHHPERSGCVRSFMPTQHRHIGEIIQELNLGRNIQIHFSATAIDMVRGVLATAHVFLKEPTNEKKIWEIYREEYGNEPFIRIIKDREGIYRYPEPKLLVGTNYCDIGFEQDKDSNRLVVMGAIDNLMKGGAGQAIQSFNILHSFEENTGLEFPGLHPI